MARLTPRGGSVGEHFMRFVQERDVRAALEQSSREFQMPHHEYICRPCCEMAYEARGEKPVGMDPLQGPGQAARQGQQAHILRLGQVVGAERIAFSRHVAKLYVYVLPGQGAHGLDYLQAARPRQWQGLGESVEHPHALSHLRIKY